MERPFDLLKQFGDGVERDAGPERAHVLGADHKLPWRLHRLPGIEADAQVLIHRFLEGFTRAAGLLAQF